MPTSLILCLSFDHALLFAPLTMKLVSQTASAFSIARLCTSIPGDFFSIFSNNNVDRLDPILLGDAHPPSLQTSLKPPKRRVELSSLAHGLSWLDFMSNIDKDLMSNINKEKQTNKHQLPKTFVAILDRLKLGRHHQKYDPNLQCKNIRTLSAQSNCGSPSP